jgi:predicted Zn-dependent protease with MMP-like domain
MLAPPGLPLHRTRSQRFDDLVLQAVARLESRWQPQLAGVEFAVEEIPPVAGDGPGHPEVPLARVEPGSELGSSSAQVPAGGAASAPGKTSPGGDLLAAGRAEGGAGRPPRIVVYRRPLLARADDEEELADLVFDVVVEQVAELLGLDPEDVDPGYGESG